MVRRLDPAAQPLGVGGVHPGGGQVPCLGAAVRGRHPRMELTQYCWVRVRL
jgi:hypothetical protein